MTTRSLPAAALTLIGILLSASALAQSSAAQPSSTLDASTVPRSVPFNGQVLTPSGEGRTGTVLLAFGLYTGQRDGAPLWSEQQLVTLDSSGRYSVILGSASADGLPAEAFAAGTPRWLGVQVEGEAEQPRFMLLSVPYALKAGDADTIGGRPVTELVTASHLTESVKSAIKESKDTTSSPNAPLVTPNALVKYQNSGGTQTESSLIDAGGRLGIGVSQGMLVSDNTELDISGAGSTTTITMRNGGSAADVVKLVGSDGSLRIGSATNANLINLIGPNVGIGTPSPQRRLHLTSSSLPELAITNAGNNAGLRNFQFQLDESGNLNFHMVNDAWNSVQQSMVFTRTGNVGIGTTDTTFGKLAVDGGNGAGVFSSGREVGVFASSDGATGSGVIGYSVSGVGVEGDTVNGLAGHFIGNVQVIGTVCASNVPCASDVRLKQHVRNLDYGLSHLMRLRPVSWSWIDPTQRQLPIGLIAQEVEEVIPELVMRDADPAKPLGLNYVGLVPMMIKAIQEQQATITALQTENAALQEQTAALNSRVVAVEQALHDVLTLQRDAQSGPRER